MSSLERERRNIRATQLAGAAVSHFLANDEAALKECLRQIPDPPGALTGMLRFAALAATVVAEDSESDPADIARLLVLRVAELES
ncbi:hypothetical protein [Streptomyces xantholiticus]|uniref:hypothetical protein n=1 Tax=Streptomyces xantholiticus TaxID=68285 RepID=UPI0016781D08|nr:hypothetical protein [Streptomyces xantholiticus]GGW61434.1 hypothetical protein GCM10010381_53260 [Streptomyces xantholiticus]